MNKQLALKRHAQLSQSIRPLLKEGIVDAGGNKKKSPGEER